MKGQTNSKTMVVRLPVEIGEQLVKLRDSNNLATTGAALQFWVQQQKDERIEEKLNFILDELRMIEDRVIRTDEKGTITALYLATVLQDLDGESGAKTYVDRLEKIVEMPVQDLLEERKIRRLKVARHKKATKNTK